jgi:hypothetical protein
MVQRTIQQLKKEREVEEEGEYRLDDITVRKQSELKAG